MTVHVCMRISLVCVCLCACVRVCACACVHMCVQVIVDESHYIKNRGTQRAKVLLPILKVGARVRTRAWFCLG